MIDYKCLIELYRDGHEIHTDTVMTIEEDIDIVDDFERDETIRDILLTKLKEEYDEDVKLLEYESLTDIDYDIYKLTY
jgi:hypothetical protein